MNKVLIVDAIRKARSKQQLPIVMVTTERGDETMLAFASEGPNAFLNKPLTAVEMRSAVAEFLAEAAQG